MTGLGEKVAAWVLGLGLVLGGATGARAGDGGAPEARRQFDESRMHIRLWAGDPEAGYVVRVTGHLLGPVGRGDAVRFDVRQGKATLATVRCGIGRTTALGLGSASPTGSVVDCETPSEAPIKATGDVQLVATYLDDQNEREEPLRTFGLRVLAYPTWLGTDGDKVRMGSVYEIDGSDQLGAAYFARLNTDFASAQVGTGDEDQKVAILTTFAGRPAHVEAALRCKVDGARLDDFDVSFSYFAELHAEERLPPPADAPRVIAWYRANLDIRGLRWGPARELFGYAPGSVRFMGDHPGQWVCDLRSAGRVLRTFRFTVDAAGLVAPHALEAAGLALPPGMSFIDVRLPADPWDEHVDPAAIKKSMPYGTPWPDAGAVAEMLGALPPAKGSIAPTKVRGAGAGRGSR